MDENMTSWNIMGHVRIFDYSAFLESNVLELSFQILQNQKFENREQETTSMERKSYTRTFKAPPMIVATSVANSVPIPTSVPETGPTTISQSMGPFVPEPIIRTVNSVQSKYDAPGEIELGLEGRLLQEFLQFEGLTRQIIDAYDYWISDTLPKRITTTVIHFSLGTIKFEDITVMNPTMMSQLI